MIFSKSTKPETYKNDDDFYCKSNNNFAIKLVLKNLKRDFFIKQLIKLKINQIISVQPKSCLVSLAIVPQVHLIISGVCNS